MRDYTIRDSTMRDSAWKIGVSLIAGVSVIVVAYLVINTVKSAKVAPEIQQADISIKQAEANLRIDEINLHRRNLDRDADLKFYGLIGTLSIMGLCGLIVASGYAQAIVRKASICIARIGQHSEIPIHAKDLQSFYPIAVNLSLAEIEASASTAHNTAYQISRQMLEDISAYTKAIAGQRGLLGGEQLIANDHLNELPAAGTPTFADLLKSEHLAPGKPLILGYHQGQPEYRDVKNLKAVAVAGWQGSGKTSTTAYMIGSSVLAYDVEAYIVDPHKNHEEGLYHLIQPLEAIGVTVINPFDTPALIQTLNGRLDRRLSGKESSDRPILFVIDELAKLAKMECFDALVTFLERCTEETRKANITFIGCSTKWTARHFKGRADIRGCMNSALVHKCKPSQADLLLEDSKEKKLVEHLQRPGDAILMTDYAGAKPVSIPFCTRTDMMRVAVMMRNHTRPIEIVTQNAHHEASEGTSEEQPKKLILPDNQAKSDTDQQQLLTSAMLTPTILNTKLQAGWKQREIERQTGINQSKISNFKNGNERALTKEEQQLILDLLFSAPAKAEVKTDANQAAAMPTLPDNQVIP